MVAKHWDRGRTGGTRTRGTRDRMEDTPLPLLLVKTTYDLFQNSKNIKFPTQVIIERGGNYYLDLFITHCINMLIIMITA